MARRTLTEADALNKADSRAKAQRIFAAQPRRKIEDQIEDEDATSNMLRLVGARRTCHMNGHKTLKLCARCKPYERRLILVTGVCPMCKVTDCTGHAYEVKDEETGERRTVFTKCSPEKCAECKDGKSEHWDRQKYALSKEADVLLKAAPKTARSEPVQTTKAYVNASHPLFTR